MFVVVEVVEVSKVAISVSLVLLLLFVMVRLLVLCDGDFSQDSIADRDDFGVVG